MTRQLLRPQGTIILGGGAKASALQAVMTASYPEYNYLGWVGCWTSKTSSVASDIELWVMCAHPN